MKRFWTSATAAPAAGEFAILLDGKPLQLPGERRLRLPYAALAEAIAAEWAAAPPLFSPSDLPLTQLANTAQERVRPHRAAIIRQLAAYGLNDLLCYRAENPPALAAREAAQWDRWLEWTYARYGVALRVTAGITPIAQPMETEACFTAALDAYSEYGLAALGVMVPALGSLVLGLAVAAGALPPAEAADIAFTDELWQEAQWGQDREALARRRQITAEIVTSRHFFDLCQG
jgi:chaperone required for assembly of F1-ATPase